MANFYSENFNSDRTKYKSSAYYIKALQYSMQSNAWFIVQHVHSAKVDGRTDVILSN